jgi:hypothetical protein
MLSAFSYGPLVITGRLIEYSELRRLPSKGTRGKFITNLLYTQCWCKSRAVYWLAAFMVAGRQFHPPGRHRIHFSHVYT